MKGMYERERANRQTEIKIHKANTDALLQGRRRKEEKKEVAK